MFPTIRNKKEVAARRRVEEKGGLSGGIEYIRSAMEKNALISFIIINYNLILGRALTVLDFSRSCV